MLLLFCPVPLMCNIHSTISNRICTSPSKEAVLGLLLLLLWPLLSHDPSITSRCQYCTGGLYACAFIEQLGTMLLSYAHTVNGVRHRPAYQAVQQSGVCTDSAADWCNSSYGRHSIAGHSSIASCMQLSVPCCCCCCSHTVPVGQACEAGWRQQRDPACRDGRRPAGKFVAGRSMQCIESRTCHNNAHNRLAG